MEPNLDDGSLTAARFYGFIFFFLKSANNEIMPAF
jgi:hypothetical protein